MRLAPEDRSILGWPLIAALAVAVLAASARGNPDVLLARDGDRLTMLPADVDEASFTNLPPVNCFERAGGRSSVTIRRGGDSLIISANLDLAGPPWLQILLVSDECGISLASHDTGCNFDSFEQAQNVEQLSLDGRVLVGAILAHLGQAGLPELTVFRAIACGGTPSEGDKLLADSILARLDADEFTTRQAASRELAATPAAVRWLLEHPASDLSPEAQTRADAALALYAEAGKWKGMIQP